MISYWLWYSTVLEVCSIRCFDIEVLDTITGNSCVTVIVWLFVVLEPMTSSHKSLEHLDSLSTHIFVRATQSCLARTSTATSRTRAEKANGQGRLACLGIYDCCFPSHPAFTHPSSSSTPNTPTTVIRQLLHSNPPTTFDLTTSQKHIYRYTRLGDRKTFSFNRTNTPSKFPSKLEFMSIENLKTFDPFAEADEDTGETKQSQNYIHIRIQRTCYHPSTTHPTSTRSYLPQVEAVWKGTPR